MTSIQSDFLVIGSGLAGLVFALEAARRGTVTVLVKDAATHTNTAWAQGGIAAVLSASDSFENHVADTLVAGCGLNNLRAVELLVAQAPQAIAYLQRWGVPFCQNNAGLDLHLEGGHSAPRIAHVHDSTGLSLQTTLLNAVRAHPAITLLEHRFAIDLNVAGAENGTRLCTGVTCLNTQTGEAEIFIANATLLATGGLGQVFTRTTNPAVATADGLAMAVRAGAHVKDLEFVQFHPTALYSPGYEPVFLISEAVRGAGAVLRNAEGEEFMTKIHPQDSLAPRDVVARGIALELAAGKAPCVFLDLSAIPATQFPVLFPTIFQTCLSRGIDCTKALIPVAPAAHYACGGVITDLWGQTSLPHLFAAGEVACTGVHGANRLASNSLLEAVVFARRAAQKAARLPEPAHTQLPLQTVQNVALPTNPDLDVKGLKAELQQRMWEQAGIVRRPESLGKLYSWLQGLQQMPAMRFPNRKSQAHLELRNLVQAALLITEAALARKKSVGGHFLVTDQSGRAKQPVFRSFAE